MVNKSTIVAALPPFKNRRVLIVENQHTRDIIKEILLTHAEYAADYNKIYKYFDTGDIYSTSKGLWDFLKRNVPYTKESGDFQTVKSPAAILDKGEEVDCKNYSLFIGGVLDAIKRNEGDSWKWDYRFASYDPADPEPGHVFVVVKNNGQEIWIDPVLTHFNQKKQPMYQVDKKPKAIAGLYAISGINDNPQGKVTVDRQTAIDSFLIAVNIDLYSLRSLLLSDSTVLYGPVKQYFLKNGYPFDVLIRLLSNGK